ncbi:acyl-CoA dehydrogenase family protein [Brevundimonas sp.]|uniref:acyl-CoA dehydrogenase family protein n=1 Tax=Brevundimonas sp. TaxID=1871086 RepID=UPI003D6D5D6F
MHFALTEDQRAIRDAAQDFLSGATGAEARTAALESAAGWDSSLWRALGAELGFAGLMTPEAYGGSGLGAVEMSLVLEEVGKALPVVPLFESAVVSVTTILAAGDEDQKAALLPGLASGETIATPVWAREGETAPVLTLTPAPTLSGLVRYAPFAQAADLLLVACEGAEGVSLIALPADAPGVRVERHASLDPTRPLATVHLETVAIRPEWILGVPGGAAAALQKSWTVAAGLLAAELTGVAAHSLASTVEYVQQRVQFGRPIGSFQAVKHTLADMMVQVEAARSASLYAAAALDLGGDEAVEAASVAKAWCGDAANHCAGEAIQLHGGIGFTWEHPAHLYFKRARSSSAWLGNAALHRELVAVRMGLDATTPDPA